jgi:hypothetical protein
VTGLWDISEKWSMSARFKFASGTPRDEYIVHEDVLAGAPVYQNFQALRFSKEVITNNTQRYDNFHSLNFRVDYRTEYKGAAINAFLDVLNAYRAENPSSDDFNERTGSDTLEDGDVFPFLGLRINW